MAKLDINTLGAYLKVRQDKVLTRNDVTKRESTMLKEIKKDTTGGGQLRSASIDTDSLVSFSPSFASAQAAGAAVNTQGKNFQIPWFTVHGSLQISSDVIHATDGGDAVAWGKAVETSMAKGMGGYKHGLGILLIGQGWGEICQLSAVSGATFKPKINSQIYRFVPGMRVVFADTLHASALRTATEAVVNDVDYGTFTVTLNANVSSFGSAANDDYCFLAGCRENAVSPTRLVPVGVDGFLPNRPVVDSALTTLYGAARTARMYGQFVDGTSGGSTLPYWIDLASKLVNLGNAEKVVGYTSIKNWDDLAKDLHNNVQYVDNAASKTVGTAELAIISNGIRFVVKADKLLDDTASFAYDPAKVDMTSMGNAPQIDDRDGLSICRMATSPDYEARLYGRFNFLVGDPAASGRIQHQ